MTERNEVTSAGRLRSWAARTAREVALNVAGFLLTVVATGLLAAAIRGMVERLLQRSWIWPALAFVLLAGVAWATLFGLIKPEHLRNPEGRILPLPAMGFVLGSALVWVYIFAGLSYSLARAGAVEYTVARQPEALLAFLTDAYTWHLLDLVPGLKITTTMRWTSPVDLDGGARGALLLLFRAVVIYQVVAKGRQLLNPDPLAGPAAGFKSA
jgi:hypothetical protein